MNMVKNEELRARAQKVIPNGMYGHLSVALQASRTPQFYSKAKGAYLWDYDGNRYIDYMCAFGPNLLGYGHQEVDAAFKAQLDKIDCATAPSAKMIELAEEFVGQITHADWAMFCKNGTDATTMAMTTARAFNGRRKILLATDAYHGATTWCTPVQEGIVAEDRAHFIYYEYNNADSLRAAADEAGDDLAGIFATPFKHEVFQAQVLPEPHYARVARHICDDKDALLILDDVRAGFRLDRDCSWQAMGIEPDLSTWGKTLANGHPISAMLGSDRAKDAAGRIFVTGSFWFGAAAMAAALKTLELIRSTDYLERSITLGDQLRKGLKEISKETGLAISQTGPTQMPLIMLEGSNGQLDAEASVVFCEKLLDHGVFFHPFHNMFITSAMTNIDIEQTLLAANEVAKEMVRIGVAM